MPKANRETLTVNLPFDGFYHSIWSQELDNEEERFVDWRISADNDNDDAEAVQPPELRLDSNELYDIVMDCIDYSAAHEYIAKKYVAAFEAVVGEHLGFKKGVRWCAFESVDSPREYNFTTDRVYADVPLAFLYLMFRRSRSEGHVTLKHMLAERFTSYDDFRSHYSNDLATWLSKPLRDWDHNETGTLLLAMLAHADFKGEELRWAIFDNMSEGDDFSTAFDNGMDWDKLKAKIDDARNDKREAYAAEHPELNLPPVRCPLTLSLPL